MSILRIPIITGLPMSHRFARKALVISGVFFLLLASGCATIVKGTTQTVPVASNPPNADVIVDGNLVGQTPVDVELKRKRDHLITVEKEGYEPKSVPIVKNVGGAVWGNIIAGGLIGWGVDASSGAQYNLKPKMINVTLDPVSMDEDYSAKAKANSEFVAKLNQLDEMHENKTLDNEEYLEERARLFQKYFPEMAPEGLIETYGQTGTPPVDEPEAAPAVAEPESVLMVDEPEATLAVDESEAEPTVDYPEAELLTDEPEATPTVDEPEATLAVDESTGGR